MNAQDLDEFRDRGVAEWESFSFIEETNTFKLKVKLYLREPTIFDKILAYLSGVIPAAMLARVVRKVTGKKGTPLENHLMEFYYDMSVILLKRK